MDKEIDAKKDNMDKLSILMSKLRNRLHSEKNKLHSDEVGEKGVESILNNDFMGALQYFDQGLSLNPKDVRHYLNRSYCYLKMRKYALALADVSYVLKESDIPAYLFIAYLRAGQASSGLMEYQKAESFFKEAISIDLENPYSKIELMYLRITGLVKAGYCTRDALSILEMSSDIEDVSYVPENLKVQNDLQTLDNLSDDLVYSSDDEESSNFKSLNRILNYEPGKIKLNHIANKLSTESKKNSIATVNNNSKIESKNSSGTTKRKSIVDDFAVWIGNLESDITEFMLKSLFCQYGCITNIRRPVNSNFAIIYFSDKKSVKNILQYNHYCLHGRTIIVRPAVVYLS